MRAFLANQILDAPEPLPLKRIGEICPSEPHEMWYEPLVDKPVAEMTAEDLAPLRTKAQERVVSLNKNVVPMKTHSYLGEDRGYPILSMSATYGAIYILRDPRDVAISAADHFGCSIDRMIEMMADPLSEAMRLKGTIIHELVSSWSNHVDSWTRWNHPGIYTVRYEDLLADPLDQFNRVARRFGIATDKARIEKAVQFSSFKQLQQMEAAQGFIERSEHSEKFFRSGRSGGWRDKLTAAQARQLESDHAKQMKRFGYL